MADAYDKVSELADALLAAVIAEFELAEVELPARRFVTTGTVFYDTEQLSVTLARMHGVDTEGGGAPAGQSSDALRCLVWTAAEFEVMLLRCAPTFETFVTGTIAVPSVDVVRDHGRRIARDAAIMQRGIVRAYRADAFGMGPTAALTGWEAVGEADFAGGALRVTLGLV